MNRVFDTAIERGFISQAQLPKLKNNGKKGTARETFSISDYKSLRSYMPYWIDKGYTGKTNQLRRLLRDYVLVLLNTGKSLPQKLLDTCSFIEDLLGEFAQQAKLKKNTKLLTDVFSKKSQQVVAPEMNCDKILVF